MANYPYHLSEEDFRKLRNIRDSLALTQSTTAYIPNSQDFFLEPTLVTAFLDSMTSLMSDVLQHIENPDSTH
ncbi:hypothetical protein [Celerinatantimonas sp. MCCC 1A17872]|uniref:hypothetical protein n=1 Tax=Celerinatantimonas sp. MCCC 1A17872 TaxID=3177514 RepID=UPI0038C76542